MKRIVRYSIVGQFNNFVLSAQMKIISEHIDEILKGL